ncbi:NAD-binding protein [Kordiimonas sp. SCSIO 12603]|uniref:NAD-binding protein n=1 Tax=Kordiimonas sp. SCSIO 12603 TaxID=2829596 RepID=UPI0021037DD1|nr:NAD-binding protein [Kordiimonas sp. SCSIO 12603]UTW57110.1 NAD-binding protein [Kordiimonas sp. SCSIO 12603]
MSALEAIYQEFGADVAPFMHRLRDEVQDTKPYKGLRIAHDIPLTRTTLIKVDSLLKGGADLLVSNFSFCTPDAYALKVLEENKIPYKPVHEISGEFDVLMDCGAELLENCTAKLGAVELTRTGAVAYQNAHTPYPVISVDDTRLKQLETCLGTGEGVHRAIVNLAGRDLTDAKVMIFGFGKVGRGIAHYFKTITDDITIAEMDEKRLKVATDRDLKVVSADQADEVETLARSADVIITATGLKDIISRSYDTSAFLNGPLLANAGAEDEFGYDFKDSDILGAKVPVNFTENEPTLMKFLDPIFYAHTVALNDLLEGRAPGFHALNRVTDNAVMADWCRFHNRTEEELEAIFGP